MTNSHKYCSSPYQKASVPLLSNTFTLMLYKKPVKPAQSRETKLVRNLQAIREIFNIGACFNASAEAGI